MTVESVHVTNTYPHTDSRYECVEATVNFAVDPEYVANQRIVDLDLALRGDDGLVRLSVGVEDLEDLRAELADALA